MCNLKSIIIIAIFLIIKFNTAFSQNYKASITSFIEPVNKIVNIGPCLIEDSVFCKFEFYNKGLKSLYMERLAPSFYLGASPNDPSATQFNLFRDLPLLPITLKPNERDTLIIGFRAGDTIISKPSWHEALLALSFFDNDTKQAPPVTKIDTFLIRAKKTVKHFDNFDDIINFDSVYVNPTNPKSLQWRGKNTFYKNIILNKRIIKYITQPQFQDEFTFGEDYSNLNIIPDGIISRNFAYLPNDMGRDSVVIKNIFTPRPDFNHDSLDSSSVLLIGTGVVQKLIIKESNFDFRNDTIFLGNIKPNDIVDLSIKLQNVGNIPIFAKNESIINQISNKISNEFEFTSKIQSNSLYLPKDSIREVRLLFSSNSRGIVNYNYQIITNLDERGIYGVPPSHTIINFYIQANIVAPKMIIQSDTIDFGNIALNNEQCPVHRDSIINFTNNGNAELQIYEAILEPEYPQSPFRLINYDNTLLPSKNGRFIIAFEEISDQVKEYQSILKIKTNESQPAIYRYVVLKANTLPPVIGFIAISNNIKAKPGTQIEVPITINYSGSNPLGFAEKFSADFIYNKTLLQYIGTTTLNTATEGSINNSDISESENNSIRLDFQSIENNNLISKDTIVKLRFNTYLGDAISTEIALINPQFGDSRCNNLFNLKVINGIFTTDSVCGIEYKAVQKPKNPLSINYFYNQSNRIFEYSVPYKDNIELTIYDSYGNKKLSLINQVLPAGVYQISLNENELMNGVYFITIKNSYSIQAKQFVIAQ